MHKLAAALILEGSKVFEINIFLISKTLYFYVPFKCKNVGFKFWLLNRIATSKQKATGFFKRNIYAHEEYFAFQKFLLKIYLNWSFDETLKFRRLANVEAPKSDENFSKIYEIKLSDMKMFRVIIRKIESFLR